MAKKKKSAKPVKKTAMQAGKKRAVKKAPKKSAQPLTKKAVPSAAKKANKVATKLQTKPVAPTAKKTANLSAIFNPLDDRVVIQKDGFSTRTPGGLYIPDTAESVAQHHQGKVVAVGRGRLDKKGRVHPLDVQTGDTVLYSSHAGSEMKVNGDEFVILRENEILGVRKP